MTKKHTGCTDRTEAENLVQASTGSSLTAYVYDDENRLVRITNGPPASPPPQVAPMRPSPLPGWRTDLVYDGLGRLRIRHEYSNTVNGWWLDGTTLYIYDGNRVIQERNGTMVPTVSYTRGSDLSGSLEGAGGIGGLLARSTGNGSTWTSHAYYHADGNGNITTFLDGTQSVAAAYRYDPFGNALAKTGTLADANVYRFSSKELHAKSGMYYYLYRFYDPNLQRWLNRDPLGEESDLNLYRFCYNDPAAYADRDGLAVVARPSPHSFEPPTTRPSLIPPPPQTSPPLSPPPMRPPVRPPPLRIPGPFGIAYICGWLGATAVDLGSIIIWPEPSPNPLPPRKSFKQAKKDCIEECTDETLPTGTRDGAPFYKCMHDCMEKEGYHY